MARASSKQATPPTKPQAKTKSRPKRAVEKTVVNLDTALADIRAALVAGRHADAMTVLARAWAATPAAELAALAVAIDKRLPRQTLPPPIAEREAAWLALASTHDPAHLPTLLAADWPTHPREAKARLNELVELPPDPRIAEAFLALRAAKRYKSNAGDAFWRLAFITIGGWGESRIAVLAEDAKRTNDIDWYGVFQPVKKAVTLRPAPVLTVAQQTALAALAELAGAGRPVKRTDLDALLAAVYEDPANDGPRLVYADALLAEENPRGELIQLQLAPKPSAKAMTRMRALIRAHGATWTDGVDVTGDPVFRRGFLSEAIFIDPPADPPRGWRTVETLRFALPPKTAALVKFLAHDNLASITRLGGISSETLPALAGRAFESIWIGDLGRVTAAPRIRELGISWMPQDIAAIDQLAWYDASPIEARALTVSALETALPVVAPWFQSSAKGRLLERLTIRTGQVMSSGWTLALARDGDFITLNATWLGGTYGERSPVGLGAAIARLPSTMLSRCLVTKAAKVDESELVIVTRELEKALAKQIACETSIF